MGDKKEYIERGALIEIFNCKSDMALGTPKAVFANAAKMVELMPAADVVEVVRCKDCRHNAKNGGDCDRVLIHTHRNYITETNEYEYFRLNQCEYGAKMDGGKEQT